MEGFVRSPREPGGLETSNADVFEVHHVAQSRQINALNPAGTERAPTEKAMQRYAGKKAPRPSAAVARQVRAQKQSAEKRKGSIEQDAERATEAGSADVTSNARVTTQGPIAEVEEDEAYQVWGTKAFKVREVRRRSSGNGTRNGNGNGNARRPSLDLSKVQSAPMEDQENIHVLGEVSSRLLGAQKKNGVVAVKVKEFSFADEALERAVPPPPRYPHQPRKKVQRKGPGQTGSFSRATSVWDEKSVRSLHERPLSARPTTGVRVEASEWFRPQSARGANEIATERKTRLGRHVESSPAQRPVPIADWLREQEELDSSGAERASESPRARALLASIRGPLSPNQTSDSYVQRLERMLVSLRGELEGRGGEGGVRNVQEEGEGDVGNVAEMDRTDGVFRAAKVGSPKRQTGQEGIGEALKERTKNGGELGEGSAAKESRRGDVSDAEASTENSPRPRWKLPYKTVIRKDESLEREPPSEKTKRIVKDTAQRHDQTASSVHVETRSGEEQPPDEAADLATGEAREEELRSAWPELSVREQDYRRALGIAPGWDSKAPKRASEVEERENDSGGLENEVDARTKLSGSTGRRGSRNGQTEGAPGTRRKKDTEKGAYEEGRSGERRGTFDTARETSGSESSAREKERGSERRERRDVERGVEHTEKKRAAWKTGGWEHVAGPGMRGGPEGDVTADVEIGDERGGSIGKSRKKNSERTGGEASVWKTSGGKKRGPYRGQADDSRSSASDVSSSGEDESPRWAERSRAHGGAERLYDSSAYDDDAEEVLRPNYYSDGEADQRTAYTMDRRAAYGTESAPLQRPKSARTVGRLWQEDSPRASEGGASERSFSGGYGRATYSGGVERVTFPGGVKGPCQLATEHSCHRNCVRYLGVPRGATVPQPFGFDERERLRGRSIAEKRTAQDLALKDEVDWYLTKNHLKANPLPRSTVLPRYAKLAAARERRRREVHTQSMELLRSREKPFSFYNRETLSRTRGLAQSADLEAAKQRGPAFKANPVPATVKEKKFESLVKEMEAKKELRKRRALEELKNSRLPPRMEMHEKGRQAAPAPKLFMENEASFKPRVKIAVPDFEKLQRRFKASLERARAELPVTKTEAFSFYEKPSLSARKKDRIARDIDQDEERLPEQRWPFMAPRTKTHPTPPPAFEPPTFTPAKTLAVKLKELKVKEEMEQGLYDNREERERRKAEQRKKEDQRRKALWESFQRQNSSRMSKSGSYRASRKKGTWRGLDGLSLDGQSSDMHRTARMKQEEERAREIVEQALMDNGLPFSLDEILDA